MPNEDEPPGTDPDNVPETLCLGKFNITPLGPLAVLTFTHVRPRVGPQLDENRIELESVVRARIVTSQENIVALRDLLNRVVQDKGQSAAPASAGGSTRLN